ncbi:D-alanyl-D-alanine carboxypeptidase/D-alanyl-D-alanine-endopeptidase [Alkalihalobacillus sp. BA299]|uniref:D-alanyl-D-alanine carboxypeptidase/D-alanyl-D-alanine endopeptidase n=1 Tax=Alkalihalobacillus sp. BA299 TaxID=2815938 RepID=UPI001ADD4441|nr:D-alanyl-D-alanine carboxypeptidase/D-alanyl-D-alanine-endopeptidase [Alkalihalobacillus sp. BA299]
MKYYNQFLVILISILIITAQFFLHIDDQVLAATRSYSTLASELDQLLSHHPSLDGATASISIRLATTGEIIYDFNGNHRLKPASNLKILTSVAALTTLGKAYRFETELLADGNIKWGFLNGNLYVKGKGDPTLLKTNIDDMVRKLKNQGVKVIRGDLIGDDTWYDDVRYSIDLPWSDETMGYGTPISALSVSSNEEYDMSTVTLEIVPGTKLDSRAHITLHPQNNYVEIRNETITIPEDEKGDIKVERTHGTNRIVIQGTVPINGKKIIDTVSIWEPTNFALHLFKRSLNENGIKLLGNIYRGVTPKDAKVLVSHFSRPLSDLLHPFMKLSKNGYGEIFVKEMGMVKKGEGSWEKGLDVMETVLSHYGLNIETILLRDGSGISHVNLIPAHELTKLLYSIQKEKWYSTFFQSLPVAGVADKMIGGTLQKRMTNSSEHIRAKTGTLTTVSSISGYVETKSGETIIFSILLNNMIDNRKGKELEDQIVMILANS